MAHNAGNELTCAIICPLVKLKTMSTRIARHIVIVVVVLVTLGGTAWLVWRAGTPVLNVQLPGVRTYDPPVPMPTFALSDVHGKPFTRTQLTNHWTLLFFGYTHCPDVCPTTLATLAQTMKILPADAQQRVQVVFVTVDPDRDLPAMVAEYISHFDSRFQGIAGHSQAQLNELTGPLNIAYEYEDNVNEAGQRIDGYQVHHMASVMLIDPAGRLVADAAPPHSGESLAQLVIAARTTYGETP